MTNEVGEYAFSSVLPGPYTVRVSLPGFKTEVRKGFRIGTQQSAVLDFTLEVGAIAEQVTVTGDAPLIERASATQAASLDKEALQNLPIFWRNTFFSAIPTPGVIQTGDPQFVRYQDQSGSSQLSLGGGPRRGNGYLIEGVSITDLTNRPTIAPSMEAVEELKVQTKTYEADMGHAAGGVFNTAARSGSNTWRGSAEYPQGFPEQAVHADGHRPVGVLAGVQAEVVRLGPQRVVAGRGVELGVLGADHR